MIRQLAFTAAVIFISLQSQAAAEIIVKSDTIDVSGYSEISSDKLTVYGGIAGDDGIVPISGDSNSTVNTCNDSTLTSIRACNQKSVHSGLSLRVSFQVTKDVSSAAVKAYLDTTLLTTTSPSTVTATANSTTVTIETTWGEICSALGIGSNCLNSTSGSFTKSLKFGVDSDASGDVDDAEKKTITLKIHYMASADSGTTLSFCTGTAVGSGMCNLEFFPGDQKAFINSALYGGTDGSFPWDAIAVFPVPVGSNSDSNVVTTFYTALAEPIFKTFDPDDGTIPDSAVGSDSIVNGERYCFIYGVKNQTQNIYKFVTSAGAAATACLTPSEVAGLLDDKSCFISTAAFGSDMAPEVQTFRAFRNKFLLKNKLGKSFVRTYYKLSPPAANLISQNDYLRSMARTALYPFLFFASVALKFGLLAAITLFLFLTMSLTLVVRNMRFTKASLLIFVLLLSPFTKAAIVPEEKTVQHEGAKEGLVRITKDGTYVYDTPRIMRTESSKLTFGIANQPDISLNIDVSGTQQTYNFENLYSQSSGVIIGYDYEKYLWNDSGKLGYQLGVSLMLANGNGILKSTGQASLETFTFLTVPITAGGVYRFEYKDKQLIVPYVAGGGTLLALFEKRDDEAAPNKAFGGGFYGAGGALFNVSSLDPDSSFQLDNEYGISNLWLTLEFRLVEVSASAFSFSNAYVNAGVSFDF